MNSSTFLFSFISTNLPLISPEGFFFKFQILYFSYLDVYLYIFYWWLVSAQPCPTLCDPTDCSMPGSGKELSQFELIGSLFRFVLEIGHVHPGNIALEGLSSLPCVDTSSSQHCEDSRHCLSPASTNFLSCKHRSALS